MKLINDIVFIRLERKTANPISLGYVIRSFDFHSFKRKNLSSYLTRSGLAMRLIASLAWDALDFNFCIDLLKVDMLHLASSLIHLSPQRLDG